jgi:hypothetical protein
MPDEIKLHKVAIKAVYKPTFAPYERMDSVAMQLTADFAYWQRHQFAVELWDTDSHRIFQMQFNNCYFGCDSPGDVTETVHFGSKLVDSTLKKFEVNKLERLGVAHTYIVPEAGSFQNLVFRCEKAFHVPVHSISAFDGYELHDTAYVVNVEDKSARWTYTVMVGPMIRTEFLAKNPIDMRLYDIERYPVNHHRDAIPETLLYLSIDAGRTDCDRQQAILNVPEVSRRSLKMAQQLSSTLRGDK